jgi:hypothetical protein
MARLYIVDCNPTGNPDDNERVEQWGALTDPIWPEHLRDVKAALRVVTYTPGIGSCSGARTDMSVSQYQIQSQASASHPSLRRRILRMATVWAALGAFMGAGVGLEGGGIIGAVAGMIGGMVELAVLGAIFALIGGNPRESIVGAGLGLLLGLTAGMVGKPAPVSLVACFGLLYGAIAGATLRPYLRLLALPFILLGRLLRRQQPPAVVAVRIDGRSEHRPCGLTPAAKIVFERRHPAISVE